MGSVNLDLLAFYNVSRICTENLSSEFHQFDKRAVSSQLLRFISIVTPCMLSS